MKRVYLCFAEADTRKVNDLLALISGGQCEFDYYEVPLDLDPATPQGGQVRREIGEKIVKCSAAVCLISENTCRSGWVDIALQKNLNKGNRIIAMALKGTQEAVLPRVIKEENLVFYPWDPVRLKKLLSEEPPKAFH